VRTCMHACMCAWLEAWSMCEHLGPLLVRALAAVYFALVELP